MPVKLISPGGGSVVIAPASTSSNYTLTVPAATANVVTTGDTGTVTGSMIAAATVGQSNLSQGLTSMTLQASTSGSSIDFTGIPSWVRRITVMFNTISTNGSSNVIVQLGSGSIDTSSYVSSGIFYNGAGGGSGTATNGFLITNNSGSTDIYSGIATICTLGSNIWVHSSSVGRHSSAGQIIHCGTKTLSGVLDRLRITTAGGTDAFDSGSINVMYE